MARPAEVLGLLLMERRVVTTDLVPPPCLLPSAFFRPSAPLVGFRVEKGCRVGEGVYTLRDRAAGHAELQMASGERREGARSGEPGAGWVSERLRSPGAC